MNKVHIFASFISLLCKNMNFSGSMLYSCHMRCCLNEQGFMGDLLPTATAKWKMSALPGCQKSRLLVEGRSSLALLAPSVYTLRPTRSAPDLASTRDRKSVFILVMDCYIKTKENTQKQNKNTLNKNKN